MPADCGEVRGLTPGSSSRTRAGIPRKAGVSTEVCARTVRRGVTRHTGGGTRGYSSSRPCGVRSSCCTARACALRLRRFSRSWAARRAFFSASFMALPDKPAAFALTSRHPCAKGPLPRGTGHAARDECCRSSVVERILGKAEVVSSILTGSTTQFPPDGLERPSAGRRARTARFRRISGCVTSQFRTETGLQAAFSAEYAAPSLRACGVS